MGRVSPPCHACCPAQLLKASRRTHTHGTHLPSPFPSLVYSIYTGQGVPPDDKLTILSLKKIRIRTTTMSAAAVAVLLLAALASAAGALQCGQVTQLVLPCMPYLSGAPGMTPYGLCCNSLGVLNQLAATTADRVAACNCIKATTAGGFPPVDFTRASGLPAACGISISFPISPNLDCNRYVLFVAPCIPYPPYICTLTF
jgi:hypothetical protein